ncbi:PAS domain-containing protein [Geomesophilobacter sediminis]|uniref:histidine kinase n=1 Tax=Geomesophilobacter sediminis TaxID=2798584 RepID=A0A8J7LYS1_9BACT|nr:PAS domain-containing protein [Geomesophilobacter sediminis]MBJ6725476.1 PAS domain-containing protein [Geomesophilobacter sediminis]
MIRIRSTAAALLFLVLAGIAEASAAPANELTLGVLAIREKSGLQQPWQPLADLLTEKLPGYAVRLTLLDHQEMITALQRHELDFVLTNPSQYIFFRERFGFAGLLASVITVAGDQRLRSFGGVIFTRADRTDIKSLADISGKKIACVNSRTSAFGGYQMQLLELRHAGLQPPPRELLLDTGTPHDRVIQAVLDRRAEVGFVRTGIIEQMAREGKVDPKRLKVLNRQELIGYPYLCSTRLYPEWAFIALPHVDDRLAAKVAAILLGMEHGLPRMRAAGIYGFTPPADYEPVERLLRELRQPPYDVVPSFTLADIWTRFPWWLAGIGAAALVILLLALQLLFTNRRLRGAKEELAGRLEELTRSEDALRRLNRELRAISDCNQVLVRAQDEQTLLDEVCRIICAEAGYRMAWVGYAEHDESRSVRPVASGGGGNGYLATAAITWGESGRGLGPTGTAIRTGESVCVQDFISDPRVGPWREDALQRGFRASVSLPLKGEEQQVFGVLVIYSPEPNSFNPEEVRLLEELAGDLAFGITTLRLRTSRRQADADLQASEERFRKLSESSPIGIYETDAAGRALYLNDKWCEMAGLPREEALGTGWAKALHPEDRERVLTEWGGCVERRSAFASEFRFVTPGGELRYILSHGVPVRSAQGEVVGYVGANEDITELRRSEEALRSSERRLSLAFSATADAIWEWNVRTGETYYSPRWYQMLGYDPGELPMKFDTWKSLCQPDDLDVAVEKLAATLATPDGTGYHAEFRMRHKSGAWLWIMGRGNVVERDENGQPLTVSGTNTDITERKNLEAQLHQSQKMESIGRLAGGVAHDFNNMLTVIAGSAEIAKLKVSPTDPVWENLDQITKAAERSSQITRQLLAFSRKQAIAPKRTDINSLIKDSEKNLGRLIGEDVKLTFKPGHDLWPVLIDPSQVDQVLMNLSVNARDAMPNGGSLTIETGNVAINEGYSQQHLDARPGEYVQLIVSDTGCGMDRETREHIFEPFFTTKATGHGTGLGLATVYGAVTQNGGFINCYSEIGRGTVFRIYFPRLVDEAAPREEVPQPAPVSGTGTILLVEDEEALLQMAAQMLEQIGYTVIQAQSPQVAITLVQQEERPIDLVLTDVVMPAMNGKEMVDRIRELRPGIRVLFMSGYTSDILAQRGISEEGAQFIQKPLGMQQLSEKVKAMLTA